MGELFEITTRVVEKLRSESDAAIFGTIKRIGEKYGYEYIIDESKVLEMLTKNRPTAPVYIPMQSLDDPTPYDWKCPYCNSYLGAIIHDPHCRYCGQKLDWENAVCLVERSGPFMEEDK